MQSIDKTIAVCGRGLIADAAAAALQDFAAITRVTAEILPVPGAWDGLVVASDCWDLGAHSAAHQACQARRVPWMPIHTELSTAVIGPLTRPGRPGCPVCFGLRRKHNSVANEVRSDVVRTDDAGLAASEASVILRAPRVRVPGGGRTWDYRTSDAVAVLEALERYGGSNPTGKRTVVRASLADLEEPALDPRRLGMHEDAVYDQMPHLYRPFTEESVCNWVWGYSLTAGNLMAIAAKQIAHHVLRSGPARPPAGVVTFLNGRTLRTSTHHVAVHPYEVLLPARHAFPVLRTFGPSRTPGETSMALEPSHIPCGTSAALEWRQALTHGLLQHCVRLTVSGSSFPTFSGSS